jgi:hypothetical protein
VRELSFNIQTFSELIENDRIYIDKTAIIHIDARLYQAGYLTIKSHDPENRLVELAYPNFELKDSMEFYLLSAKCNMVETDVAPVVAQLRWV